MRACCNFPSLGVCIFFTLFPSKKMEIEEEKEGVMKDREIEILIKNIKETLKRMNLEDGDIITRADEDYRVHVSPYRMTMELRFPKGINNMSE